MASWQAAEYTEAMPVIWAREMIENATAIAIGSGTVQEDERRRIMRDWQRQAGGQGAERRTAAPRDHLDRVEAMGIAVEVVRG